MPAIHIQVTHAAMSHLPVMFPPPDIAIIPMDMLHPEGLERKCGVSCPGTRAPRKPYERLCQAPGAYLQRSCSSAPAQRCRSPRLGPTSSPRNGWTHRSAASASEANKLDHCFRVTLFADSPEDPRRLAAAWRNDEAMGIH